MEDNKKQEVQVLDDERDILLDHEYDGIKELDNHMPAWWVWGFFFTIIVGQIYLLYYHVTDWGALPQEEYTEEVQAAAAVQKARQKEAERNSANQPQIPWETTLLTDVADLEAGKVVYNSICNACHGPAGQGLVGPNFTDDLWIYGCSVETIMNGAKTGFPQAGMPMYGGGKPLNNKELQQVASYILSLKGTNPPNPKAPDLNREKPCTPE